MKKFSVLSILFLLFLLSFRVVAEESLKNEFQQINILYNRLYQFEGEEKEEVAKQILKISDNMIEKNDNINSYLWVLDNYSYLADYTDQPAEILERGREHSKRLIEIIPDQAYGYFWEAVFIGQIAQKRGIRRSLASVKPMRDNLEKAIEINPNFAPAYDVMAELYLQAPGWPLSIGNDKKALEYRKKSVNLEPNNYHYRWQLYENYLLVDEKHKAKGVLEQILEMPVGDYREDYVEYIKGIAKERLMEF